MSNQVARAVAAVVGVLIRTSAFRATKYLAPNLTVKATRRGAKRRPSRKNGEIDIVLNIGRPNYAERKFIKACKKAGEPFPVKRVQIKLPQLEFARSK